MIKPSLTRVSVPYRGPTSSEDYMNFLGEVIQNIRKLMFYMDRNENLQQPGHTSYIEGNNKLIMYSEYDHVLTDIPNNIRLYKGEDEIGWYSFQGINQSSAPSIKSRLSNVEDGLRQIENNL